ncbi:unnamed protein product [Prorocentrum cordatum]|uniref:NADP-dependent oxidoreductase domain-containing protein n=1 Tax=Prorocentrum cordatum TaxID=2364126 RepID=A0ABN9WWD8_9DINO|nr:unnamed protein product [Polarella glacialis]
MIPMAAREQPRQRDTVAYCRKEGIAVMAYSPLARAQMFGKTALRGVAERRGCSEAQTAIRWVVQQGLVAIPKSAAPARIAANAAAVSGEGLSAEDLAEVDKLDFYQHASCAAASSAMGISWADVAEAIPDKAGARGVGAGGGALGGGVPSGQGGGAGGGTWGARWTRPGRAPA